MAFTLRAFGSVSTIDAPWTPAAVRAAVRKEHGLKGPLTVTLGELAGIVAHVDDRGDLLVMHVGKVS